ncbi:hypothetical protein ACEPAI_8061 [Sanghuangporus weigelae]
MISTDWRPACPGYYSLPRILISSIVSHVHCLLLACYFDQRSLSAPGRTLITALSFADAHVAEATDGLRKYLTSSRTDGEMVLVVVSSVSLTAVVLLLLIILITALRASYQKASTNIFRSHVTAYFVSLLVSDLLQSIGSIMNLKWIQDMAVSQSGFCSAQGAIKQAADIGTAFWYLTFVLKTVNSINSLLLQDIGLSIYRKKSVCNVSTYLHQTIAVHTFNVLVCGIHARRILMFILLVAVWSFVTALVGMGPFILQNKSKGPYFNISGYWCWISEKYEIEQFVLEYMIMFISAVASFILYVLVFLKLRSNLLVAGGRFRFRSVVRASAWMPNQNYETSDLRAHMVSVAKHMLLYPIAYMILIVPIAACRFAEWTGHEVPFYAIVFSDSVFLLSGFVNTLLFVLTGRVLPLKKIVSMFKSSYSEPCCQAELPDSKAPVSRERESIPSSSWNSLSTWREKDLPQLPLETYSTTSRTSYSVSHGRRSSEPFSHSETSSLLNV